MHTPKDIDRPVPSGSEGRRAFGQRYELRDVSVSFFGMVVLGLLLLTLLGMAVSLWFFNFEAQRTRVADVPPPPLAETLPAEPPQPRLQEVPAADLQKLEKEERDVLENYAWIDEKSGIVRIPIDRAIELLAERGLPARTAAGSPESGARATPEPKQ